MNYKKWKTHPPESTHPVALSKKTPGWAKHAVGAGESVASTTYDRPYPQQILNVRQSDGSYKLEVVKKLLAEVEPDEYQLAAGHTTTYWVLLQKPRPNPRLKPRAQRKNPDEDDALEEDDAVEEDTDQESVAENLTRRLKRGEGSWESDFDRKWSEHPDEYLVQEIVKHIKENFSFAGVDDKDKESFDERLASTVSGYIEAGEFCTESERRYRAHRGELSRVASIHTTDELYVSLTDEEAKLPEAVVLNALTDAYSGKDAWYKIDDDAWSYSQEGERVGVYALDRTLAEIVSDVRTAYFSKIVDTDPKKALESFLKQLEDEGVEPELRKFIAARQIPEDELKGLMTVFWSSREEFDTMAEEIVAILNAPRFDDTDPKRLVGVIEFFPQAFDKLGRPKTDLPEEERSPWRVIRLSPGELTREGLTLRHCVGQKDMGYHRALRDGEIEIWSVRSATNKPLFTIEVDVTDRDPNDDSIVPLAYAEHPLADNIERAHRITQIRGTANRSPGFDFKGSTKLTRPNEVWRLESFFQGIGCRPKSVVDLAPGLDSVMPRKRGAPLRNPGVRPKGFDSPYVPPYEAE